MKLDSNFAGAALCLVLMGGLWFGGQIFASASAPAPAAPAAPPAAPIARPIAPAATPTALADPAPSAADDGARITYPPGQYPQMLLPNGQVREVHSVLNVPHALAFGDYVWDAKGVASGPVWVRIDLSHQILSVFRGGDEIGTAVIIYGANDHPTPVGIFHILEKNQYYYSKSYDAPMPFALRLTDDGVALHASSVREHVATHGCVGLPMEFARLLFSVTSRGDQVAILPDHPA